MSFSKLIVPSGSVVNKRRLPIIIIIALSWTLADFILFLIQMSTDSFLFKYEEPDANTLKAILLRELNVLLVSFVIGFLLISVLRRFFRGYSPWLHFVLKTLILIGAGLIMSFLIYISYELIIRHRTLDVALNRFMQNTFRTQWIIPKMAEWAVLYIWTQLAIEVNEKYSPGVFIDIVMGKYLQPREEARI